MLFWVFFEQNRTERLVITMQMTMMIIIIIMDRCVRLSSLRVGNERKEPEKGEAATELLNHRCVPDG